MHIFIDESGTFAPESRSGTSISTVGALVIPTQAMNDFQRLFGRVRKRLPTDKGEVKGRRLNEEQVGEVVGVLRKVGALFEVAAIDMADHTIAELENHRYRQAQAILAHVTPEHHPGLVADLERHKSQLERMPLQLYVQSAMLVVLIYTTINLATTYFAFRWPKELGRYHWVIDAKERSKTTNWENWWSISVLAALESKSFREPFMEVRGGDYSAQQRFRVEDIGDYKRQFVREPGREGFHDLKAVMREDFRFSADPEPGLEAVDILTNAVRRSLNGNFQREGWISIPQLMINRDPGCIGLCQLTAGVEDLEYKDPPTSQFGQVVRDFRLGGRSLLPRAI